MSRYEKLAALLQKLSMTVTQAAEVAELHLERLDGYVFLMHQGGLLQDQVRLGHVFLQSPYPSEENRSDSSLTHQACIIPDLGIGALVLDMEEYILLEQRDELEVHARHHFVHHAKLSPIEKSLLLVAVQQMIEGISAELTNVANRIPSNRP
jgi:hypothetical protein